MKNRPPAIGARVPGARPPSIRARSPSNSSPARIITAYAALEKKIRSAMIEIQNVQVFYDSGFSDDKEKTTRGPRGSCYIIFDGRMLQLKKFTQAAQHAISFVRGTHVCLILPSKSVAPRYQRREISRMSEMETLAAGQIQFIWNTQCRVTPAAHKLPCPPPAIPYVIDLDSVQDTSDLDLEGTAIIFNFPAKVVVVYAVEIKKEPRVDLRIETQAGHLRTITAWNHHAYKDWSAGSSYLFCRAEASKRAGLVSAGNATDVNINIWSSSPVFLCDGEFEMFASGAAM